MHSWLVSSKLFWSTYEYGLTLFLFFFFCFTDHRVPDEVAKVKAMIDIKRSIHEAVLEVAQHADRLAFTSKISQTQKPTTATVLGTQWNPKV